MKRRRRKMRPQTRFKSSFRLLSFHSSISQQNPHPILIIFLLLPTCCLLLCNVSLTSSLAVPKFPVGSFSGEQVNYFDSDQNYRQEPTLNDKQPSLVEGDKFKSVKEQQQQGTNNLRNSAHELISSHHESQASPNTATSARDGPWSSSRDAFEAVESQQQPDDLLAIESTRLLTVGRQPRPPYDALAEHAPNFTQEFAATQHQNRSSIELSSGHLGQATDAGRGNAHKANQLQLLKLYRAPPTPIFLRPPQGLVPPQNQQLNGYTGGRQSSQPASGTAPNFALLPSWPSVYVAQQSPNNGDEVQQSQRTQPLKQVNESWPSTGGSEPTSGVLSKSAEYGSAFSEEAANGTKSEPNKEGESGPEWAKLLDKASRGNGTLESLMVTNRTIVSLLCDTNDMLVRLKFKKPFRGFVGTNLEPLKSCRLFGNGSHLYEMRIGLYECGTRQEMPRLFINNIQIRFSSSSLDGATVRGNSAEETALEDGADGEEELKTIICSYPIRPRALEPTDKLTTLLGAGSGKDISDKLIQAKIGVGQAEDRGRPARLVYYEPLVMLAGLLVVVVAILAATTTAYLLRRRREDLTGDGSYKNSLLSDGSGRYSRAPAQVANKRQLQLIAPPLITSDTLKRANEEQRRGALERTPSKRKRVRQERKRAHPIQKRFNQQVVEMVAGDDSLDSQAGGSSVTTIEIPFAGENGHGDKQQPQTVLKDSLVLLQPTGRGEASSHREERESINIPVIVETTKHHHQQNEYAPTSEQKRPRRRLASSGAQTASRSNQSEGGDEQVIATKRLSPLPFGSFRSKLTSPSEFRRLAAITEIFDERSNAGLPGGGRRKQSKYDRLIAKNMDPNERRLLSDTLKEDEVFRSHVVDSLDGPTFSRKLRNNPKYANKFKAATWRLLELILMDPQVGTLHLNTASKENETGIGLDARETSDKTRELLVDCSVVGPSAKLSSGDNSTVSDSMESKSGETLAKNVRQPSQRDSLERLSASDRFSTADQSSENEANNREEESRRDGDQAMVVRVSQFSSTRSDSYGTQINIDSVTNFSSPRNFSARTSSRIEQRTSYQVDDGNAEDSLPFMDEKVASYDYT